MIKEFLEILLLSFTIFAESSGEPCDGKIAVGSVIRNRVEILNRSYSDVILQKKQFSCYNTKEEIFKHLLRLEKKSFKRCLEVAIGIYTNQIEDNTNGALFYVRIDIEVSWMRSMLITKIINKHKFMKEEV